MNTRSCEGSAHTPGPWTLGVVNDLDTVTVSAFHGTRSICDIVGDMPVDLANARLITAAPELLAALKGVLLVADRQTDEFDAARAAIAKAEGRS